jgi:putative peptidoglycan lipid II flippase
LRFAIVRVALGIALGFLLATRGPQIFGLEAKWGAALLTAASGLAAWVEFLLLRRALRQRIGATPVDFSHLRKLFAAALAAAGLAWGVKLLLPGLHPVFRAGLALAPFGAAYFVLTAVFGVGEAQAFTSRFTRLLKR